MKTLKKKRINPVKAIRMLSITLVLVITMVFMFKTTASGFSADSYVEVTVCPGDTLWAISKEYKQGENIEKVIYEIMTLNNLKKCDLFPGQKLRIPLKY